jgi:hypothetical protein
MKTVWKEAFHRKERRGEAGFNFAAHATVPSERHMYTAEV